MRREEFDDKIRKMVEATEINNSEKRIDELEKRVGDLEGKVAELMLIMLRMCPWGVGCPYANGNGTTIPDTGDAVRPWDITCKG